MLFNDSGFVRFRLGNDPSVNQQDVLRQSCQVINVRLEIRFDQPLRIRPRRASFPNP